MDATKSKEKKRGKYVYLSGNIKRRYGFQKFYTWEKPLGRL